MFQIERQEDILNYINRKKKVRVCELSDIFRTSVVTIRSDINHLARQGLIIKTHGGALSIEDRLNLEIPYQSKFYQNIAAKRQIGKLAAELIENNDVVILDSGSTTLEIAKNIRNRDITVITNDIKIAMTLSVESRANLILTGGTVEPGLFTLMGHETEEFLRRINANKLFLGCDAYDLSFGISNRTLKEVAIKRTMINVSNEIIAVMDSSKLHKKVFANLCGPFEIDLLITDKISKKDEAILLENGVKVLVPPKGELEGKEI